VFESLLNSIVFKLLFQIVLIISLSEALVMVFLDIIQLNVHVYIEALIGALLLIFFSTPLLYIFAINPFYILHIKDEDELRQYKHAIDNHSIVAVTDTTGTITEVNNKFVEISGYSKEELIGENHRLLKSGNNDNDFWKNLYQTIANKKVWHDVILNKAKDGNLYFVDTTITPILNQQGKPKKYIAIRTDVSEIKKAESELFENNEKLSRVIQDLEVAKEETDKVIKELADQALEMQTEISRRKTLEHKLERSALYDTLTSLPNRTLLFKFANKFIANAKRYESMLGILFIDLDGFKSVNDNHSHKEGDIVLIEMSLRISDAIREIDEVCRIGGDEFIVLLPNCQSEENINLIAKRILKLISNPIESIDIHEKLSTSIGISIYPKDSQEINELINLADQAMYKSKRNGKNRFTFHCAKS
jgi:diguanylate cyclase (GGDEF)-like protein/PAS domain S-box-containing protein